MEITQAGSNATLLEQSASTIITTSTVGSCCVNNLTLGVGLETKIQPLELVEDPLELLGDPLKLSGDPLKLLGDTLEVAEDPLKHRGSH